MYEPLTHERVTMNRLRTNDRRTNFISASVEGNSLPATALVCDVLKLLPESHYPCTQLLAPPSSKGYLDLEMTTRKGQAMKEIAVIFALFASRGSM